MHPFYLGLEQDGRTHGVFLLNSNAMGMSEGGVRGGVCKGVGVGVDITRQVKQGTNH